MADVRPFRGLRYNLERAGDLSSVITPPYDVISPAGQLRYCQLSPHNVIRLDFGLDQPDDSESNNKYTRASSYVKQWLDEGILSQDEQPAFYLVKHRFHLGDSVLSRFSLVARMRLEDLETGSVRPHERTMSKPREDRLNLLRACDVNFSPIMVLFRHKAEGFEALLGDIIERPSPHAVDKDGVEFAMWTVTDEDAIASISNLLADKMLYIADGHHRYETALNYSRERRAAGPSDGDDAPYNFVMMTITPAEDPGLIMMPTHRMVKGLAPDILTSLKGKLAERFDEELLPPTADAAESLRQWNEALEGQAGTSFGLYGLDGDKLCILRAKPGANLKPIDGNSVAGSLDVSILHRAILRDMLGLDSTAKEDECLEFTRDGAEAIERVNAGEQQLAFFLNPTPISGMLAVADARERMPQKSTYFYPKTPTGLVMNPLWDD
ncbi:MAG: DUF1015 domain-containing protein [Chloroflexota bacterium]|nr:DUF1015 domain-containing protein [Chloroflexota bacterium]